MLNYSDIFWIQVELPEPFQQLKNINKYFLSLLLLFFYIYVFELNCGQGSNFFFPIKTVNQGTD